ncbi:MAG: helix-turn-helix transcriptional regulator [Chloroflexi bacterium]|nr:helix-turn-helix transcriptional regulator [Chloroflexota bacterium]
MRSPLSPRENEIASLVATGASNKEIAYQLALSPKTVTNTLTRVFAKTGARGRTELAVQIVRGTASVLHI